MRNKETSRQRFDNPYFKKRQFTGSRIYWQRLWQLDILAYVGIVIIILGAIIFIIRSNQLWYIKYINIQGNQYIPIEAIAEPAREAIQDKSWFIFPQRLYIFTDTELVTSYLYDILGEQYSIESISVEKNFADRITITIKERIPGLVYISHANANYYLDLNGVSTEQIQRSEDLNPHFPRIRDKNNRSIAIGEVVFSQAIIDAIAKLDMQFSDYTGLNVAEYVINETTCYEKEYVAEKIFADEIENTENESLRADKVDILNRLEDGDITVDQSLSLLEEVKRSEIGDIETVEAYTGNEAFLQLEAKYNDKTCSYVNAIRDVGIKTQEGPEIYFDSGFDIDLQLSNLKKVLASKIDDISTIEYIDARFRDTVYFR